MDSFISKIATLIGALSITIIGYSYAQDMTEEALPEDLPYIVRDSAIEHIKEGFLTDENGFFTDESMVPNFEGTLVPQAQTPLKGKITITVNRKLHRLFLVIKDQSGKKTQKVFLTSTGNEATGHTTPAGHYHVTLMDANAHSVSYNNAPMYYAVFFRSTLYAIHATPTFNYKYLGKSNQSHGCVRLSLSDAKTVFTLIKQYGHKNVTIDVI